MDQSRFDTFSRFLATRSTRRETVRRMGDGGVHGGLSAAAGIRSAAAQNEAVCELSLSALVSVGPSSESTFQGTLTFEIGDEGAIDDGVFEAVDGQSYDVVGTATGRAIDLRIELDDGQVLTLAGTGENDIILCRGQVDGTFAGPRFEDLGTWTTS